MKNIKESLLFKKTYGCIMGGAVGDAFGGPIEGMHYKFIRKMYNGRLTEMIDYRNRPEDFFQAVTNPGYALSFEAGTYTDDTYFQLLITKNIIEKKGRINADDLAKYWIGHLDTTKAWHALSNSFHRIAYSRTSVREAGNGNIPENSSAMCIGPIGVINACNPAQAAMDAYDVASISHDGYAREAASVIAAAVAEAMNPLATVESVVEAAVKYLPNKETSRLYEPLMLALELAEKAKDTEELTSLFYDKLNVKWIMRAKIEPDDDRHSPSIDPIESVPCALAMFYKTKGEYKDGIIAAANYGRDCDTIACMTGYIAGAFRGIESIPAEWVKASKEANPVSNIEEHAVELTKSLICEKEKMNSQVNMIEKMLD